MARADSTAGADPETCADRAAFANPMIIGNHMVNAVADPMVGADPVIGADPIVIDDATDVAERRPYCRAMRMWPPPIAVPRRPFADPVDAAVTRTDAIRPAPTPWRATTPWRAPTP